MDDVALQPVRSLSIHADYRCRHSGACCNADWDVPVELPVYRSLDDAHKSGRLHVAPQSSALDPFVVEPDLPDDAAAMLERNEQGECVFFERESRLCVVHRDLGHDALPATCRHFPRLAVRDVRGTFVGLSHYCPTAAEMLFRDDVSLTIVAAPEAFPQADYEGLSVTPDDLPPLLRPGVVMDLEAYTSWEAHMVRRCAEAATPESALATLDRDAMRVRAWTPDGPAMRDLVDALPAAMVEAPMVASLTAEPRGLRANDGRRAGRLAARAGRTRPRERVRTVRRAGMALVVQAAATVPGRQGVRIVDGVSGSWADEHRAGSRGGAGPRACGSGAGVPRRGAAARPRAAARSLPSG